MTVATPTAEPSHKRARLSISKRARLSISICLFAALLLSPLSANLHAQQPAANGDVQKLAGDVSKAINSLDTYGVFDDIRFSFKGSTITLIGYASRPTLKSQAEKAVKKIAGITAVNNQIEVLPLSPSDDSIRVGVYDAIYTTAALRKYNGNQGALRGSVATAAGGITVDPPIGFHAIHIIVKNGRVILRGTVLNKSDSDLVKIRTDGVSGVFGVENQLTLEGGNATSK